MALPEAASERTPVGAWAWGFPLTYLVHIAEEYWLGEGFPAWISRVAGANLTLSRFLDLNVFAWILMTVCIGLALSVPALGWLVTGFGAVVSINALAHLVGSVVTRSYSPGLISGVLLWLPLGVFTLNRSWKITRRRTFWIGVLVGVILHGIITLLAFRGGNR